MTNWIGGKTLQQLVAQHDIVCRMRCRGGASDPIHILMFYMKKQPPAALLVALVKHGYAVSAPPPGRLPTDVAVLHLVGRDMSQFDLARAVILKHVPTKLGEDWAWRGWDPA